MNLLYVDEAGSPHDLKQVYFALTGVSVFERQGYWLSEELNRIASRFNPKDPGSVELHGSAMFSGRGFWRKISLEDRMNAIKDSLRLLSQPHHNPTVFACVVKKSMIAPRNPVEAAFEQLASRFDYFLTRSHNKGNTQRGLIIFDKSTYESTIQKLTTDFRNVGHSWGIIKNFAEVPLFLDSKASRLIQLADLIAYAVFRKFEYDDPQFFELFSSKLDSSGGTVHGMCELTKPQKIKQ